jgi:glycosyltransferase involved in cell wall biosynthesis
LARQVARRGFDLVHSFSRLAYLAPILPCAIPKLMSYQRKISPATTRLAHRLSRGTLRFSAISQKMMRNVGNVGEWRMIPNGVPLEAYAFRATVAPDEPLVFLGRVEEIKGPHLAIEAAARAGRQLIIAGNVPDAHRGWFEVHVGPVDDSQKNELLGNACALLMPVVWDEPFGIVMAEAMACGTPVIGFRRGAVPEVVENGVTGFVVDSLDEMTDAIARIGALDRRACRARVETLYSGDAVTQGYLSLYEDMMSLKRRRADR